jgi:hypothetical protein
MWYLSTMNKRDIVIGIIVLAVLGGVIYLRSQKTESNLKVPEGQTQAASTEKSLEDKFKTTIPDDAPKAELKAVSGGDGSGIASKKEESGNYTVTVLADLPESSTGTYYQGWLVKGEEGEDDYNIVSAGRLTSAKGGYMLNFQSKTDYPDHKKVVISEEKPGSTKISKAVLEGNF